MTNNSPSGDPHKNMDVLKEAAVLANQPNPHYPASSQRGFIYYIKVRVKRDAPGGHTLFTMDQINGIKRVRKIDVQMTSPVPGLWFTSADWIAVPGMPKVKVGPYSATSYGLNASHSAHDTALGYREGVGVSQDYWFFTHTAVSSPFTAIFKAAGQGQVALDVSKHN